MISQGEPSSLISCNIDKANYGLAYGETPGVRHLTKCYWNLIALIGVPIGFGDL